MRPRRTSTTPSRSPKPPAPRSSGCWPSGDLFRYTAPSDGPVALLEAEFAAADRRRYALAVSSCSAALFLALKRAGPAAGRAGADPGLHLRRRAFGRPPRRLRAGAGGSAATTCRIDMDDFAAKLPDASAGARQPHARPYLGHGRHRRRRRGRGVPVVEDAAHSLGHALARAQDRHDRPDRLLLVPVLQAPERRRRRHARHRRSRSRRPRGHHVGRLRAQLEEAPGAASDPALGAAFARWQNRLPLYNMRLSEPLGRGAAARPAAGPGPPGSRRPAQPRPRGGTADRRRRSSRCPPRCRARSARRIRSSSGSTLRHDDDARALADRAAANAACRSRSSA